MDVGTPEATITKVAFVIDDVEIIVSGTSKRTPGDKDNPEAAILLAYGRAFETLGRKLQKKGNGLVKHADDVREYRQIQKAKRPKIKKKTKPALKALTKVSASR